MKKLTNLYVMIFFLSCSALVQAQDQDTTTADFADRSPLYDYSENNLNSTDSIPGFQTKEDKLMITGTVFESDGVTPAKDVILYISQPDEHGDYELKKENDKRYVVHRAWVKTDVDGRYTFYTFIPGNNTRFRELKHIHPIIKESGKPEYELNAFLFDNDPFLSKHCRKRLEKKGIDSILVLEKKEDMYITTKNIVLESVATAYTN